MSEEFVCPVCVPAKAFNSRPSLFTHKKRKHREYLEQERRERQEKWNEQKSRHDVFCTQCNWTGTELKRLNAHMKRKHGIINWQNEKHMEMYKCSVCEGRFASGLSLRKHMAQDHGLREKELIFQSWPHFEAWKQHLEVEKCIHFIKTNGGRKERKTGTHVTYYSCSSGGAHLPHTGRGKRCLRPSKRTGRKCSVFMVTTYTEIEGLVRVRYCDEHNHELMPQNLPILLRDRLLILEMLKERISVNQIIEAMRKKSGFSPRSRLYYLNDHDIRNTFRNQDRIYSIAAAGGNLDMTEYEYEEVVDAEGSYYYSTSDGPLQGDIEDQHFDESMEQEDDYEEENVDSEQDFDVNVTQEEDASSAHVVQEPPRSSQSISTNHGGSTRYAVPVVSSVATSSKSHQAKISACKELFEQAERNLANVSAEELEGFSEFLKKFSTRRNNREISPGQIQKTDGAQSSSVKVSNSQITRAQILPAIEYCNSKKYGRVYSQK